MHTPQKLKQKILQSLCIALGVTLFTSGLVLWNPLEKWQLKVTNGFYDRNEPSPEIVIVGIEQNSLDDTIGLGKFSDWPRSNYIKTLENLEDAGAAVIGIDILFVRESSGISERALLNLIEEDPTATEFALQIGEYLKENHPDDLAFAEFLEKQNNIVLASTVRDDPNDDKKPILLEPMDLIKGKVHTGIVNTQPDSDDLIRRIPFGHEIEGKRQVPFSARIAQLYTQKSLTPDLDQNQKMLIHYAAPPYAFTQFSFVDAYNGFVTEEDVKGKIVLIGITAESIKDHFMTPTSALTTMPGVEIHANAIQTLLEGNFLVEQSKRSQIATLGLLATGLSLAVMWMGILPGVLVALATLVGYIALAEVWFDRGWILNVLYPSLALVLAYLVTTLYKYLTESRQQAALKTAFSHYVNKDLVDKILENPDALQLGGEKRIVTTFFSDIADSTHFSEVTKPENVVSQLNEYFEVMAGIILQNNGTLDKFEGDAIMAFWGAPLEEPQHAIWAAKSALECRLALKKLHEKWQKEGKMLLDFRVGLSSGEVIAGNIGSKERFDYTVIGDIVNLGSRLEGANKVYGTHVMCSKATREALGDQFEVRMLDRLRVKGKDEAVEVFEIVAFKGQMTSEQMNRLNQFQEALETYRRGEFEKAESQFQSLARIAPGDGATQTYLKRCAELKKNPPVGWDGTWRLEHK